MSHLPEPPSRRERQQQTRAALIEAGREVFADLGYHAANLDRIAAQAGFSKGAVYSNFAGKAGLFLAVMDANLESVWGEPQQFADLGSNPTQESVDEQEQAELARLVRGFALATLEFIAVAARDEELSAQLKQRIQDVVDQYTAVARTSGREEDALSPEQLGTLLTALDQGSGLLLLGGTEMLDDNLLRVGMERLLAPTAHEATSDEQEADGTEAPRSAKRSQEHVIEALRKRA
jgi:AcrR family transcriptional regulator